MQRLLSKQELEAIITDVQGFVAKENGIDYLVVYEHTESERKLFCIDQLNKEMIDSGGHPPEHNHWTILLAEEY